jgi:hypothetical protein
MKPVIAIQGKESEKLVDGECKRVIPFVGADEGGEIASLGVGFLLLEERKCFLWGLLAPHFLIQSWRAMKILEKVKTISDGTLCACWYAAGKEIHKHEREYIKELIYQFGKKFEVIRQEILSSVPSAEEIDTMIKNLLTSKVDIDLGEIKEEINAGKIQPTPLIKELLQRS